MSSASSRSTKFAWLLLGLGGAAGFALIFFWDPASHNFYPRCPLKTIAGMECPTCGALRAMHQLLHGNIRSAYELNPFLFFALPGIALFLLIPTTVRPRWLPWAALALLAAWFVWRNWP